MNVSATIPAERPVDTHATQSDAWNKLKSIDLRCVKQIHEIKPAELQYIHIDWQELKFSMDLPHTSELYMTRRMHDSDQYYLQADDRMDKLVKAIFKNSNLASKLEEDFEILECVVTK